jgi:hypothetical protein
MIGFGMVLLTDNNRQSACPFSRRRWSESNRKPRHQLSATNNAGDNEAANVRFATGHFYLARIAFNSSGATRRTTGSSEVRESPDPCFHLAVICLQVFIAGLFKNVRLWPLRNVQLKKRADRIDEPREAGSTMGMDPRTGPGIGGGCLQQQ